MKTKNDVEGLIKVLKYKKDFKVRAEAAWVLGKIGDNRAVKPLKQTLNDENWNV
jgi:HEAT repeat protein